VDDVTVANVEAIPLELKAQRRWVPWQYEDRLDARTGELKKTKVPYQIDGRKARSNDARTWTTFGAVYAAVSGGEWDGIGFQLDGSDYTAWDLDRCRDPQTEAIEPWAADIVRGQDSYTEVTPSGTGLRILVRGKLPPGRRRRGHLEVYDELRFVTLTGHHLQDTPATIEDRENDFMRCTRGCFQYTSAPRRVSRGSRYIRTTWPTGRCSRRCSARKTGRASRRSGRAIPAATNQRLRQT
jgi:primase-polymerase (primpol)-like protein